MREAAQVIAYEIPLGISLLVPIMVAGKLQPDRGQPRPGRACADETGTSGLGEPVHAPGLRAVLHRHPGGDEACTLRPARAESELVAGFMTEYSGIRWSFFFMEEYAAMFLYSVVGAFFFFGGFESPLTGARRAPSATAACPPARRGDDARREGLRGRVPDDVAALDAARACASTR
jgi:NADH-quinone oxidoreductase subunit H